MLVICRDTLGTLRPKRSKIWAREAHTVSPLRSVAIKSIEITADESHVIERQNALAVG